jgi:hypothetical protein
MHNRSSPHLGTNYSNYGNYGNAGNYGGIGIISGFDDEAADWLE